MLSDCREAVYLSGTPETVCPGELGALIGFGEMSFFLSSARYVALSPRFLGRRERTVLLAGTVAACTVTVLFSPCIPCNRLSRKYPTCALGGEEVECVIDVILGRNDLQEGLSSFTRPLSIAGDGFTASTSCSFPFCKGGGVNGDGNDVI